MNDVNLPVVAAIASSNVVLWTVSVIWNLMNTAEVQRKKFPVIMLAIAVSIVVWTGLSVIAIK
jgi:hypothetical protein